MDTSRPSSQKDYRAPKILTEERMAAILRDVERGVPKKYAAESNGINESSFYNAIKQGLTDIAHDETETRWAKMVVSLRKIESEEIAWCRQTIKKYDKGHKGAEWTLEHAYWREFCGDAKIIQLAEEVDELKTEKNKNEA